MTATFDSIRVGRFVYVLWALITAALPSLFVWYLATGCEERCGMVEYFVFAPFAIAGLLGSISFYLLSTEISNSRVLFVSNIARLYDLIVEIFLQWRLIYL